MLKYRLFHSSYFSLSALNPSRVKFLQNMKQVLYLKIIEFFNFCRASYNVKLALFKF